MILYLLYFLLSEKSDSFYDESDLDGSDSRSFGTCNFPAFSLRFDDSVALVSGFGSGLFVPTGVESKYDNLRLLCSYE